MGSNRDCTMFIAPTDDLFTLVDPAGEEARASLPLWEIGATEGDPSAYAGQDWRQITVPEGVTQSDYIPESESLAWITSEGYTLTDPNT